MKTNSITNLTTSAAIERYCAVRDRLPPASHPAQSVSVNTLQDLVDEFDLFVLDGFGVLNVGDSPVPGAAERVHSLRAAGRTVVVLTNGATKPVENTVEKYAAWDMAFDTTSVISSRDALIVGLQQNARDTMTWGVSATSFAGIDQLPGHCLSMEDDAAVYNECDGFILLSALEWAPSRQQRLINAVQDNPRPVLVGNPDLVAPQPGGLSMEPGWHAHDLADKTGIDPVFFGKPFRNAFDVVMERFPGFEPRRIAMVGDSPHTDVLGGAAMGWRTVLVHEHGLCKTHELNAVFAQSGIRPDFIAVTT